jgi:hypothetical protein
MNVTPGEHRVALLGNPFFYKKHWIEKRKRSANCPGEGCPLCGSEDFPAGRYVVNVYNYKDKAVEVYEFGRGVKNDIATTVRLWGNNIEAFDIILTRTGKGKEDTKYTIVAVPKEEKPPKDIKLYELEKICKPTPIDKIIEILEGKEEKKEENSNENTGTNIASAVEIKSSTTSPSVEKKEGEVTIEDETAEIDLDKLIDEDN